MQQPVIARNPDVMGGTPVFLGTRVPVQTLLDYLEAGEWYLLNPPEGLLCRVAP